MTAWLIVSGWLVVLGVLVALRLKATRELPKPDSVGSPGPRSMRQLASERRRPVAAARAGRDRADGRRAPSDVTGIVPR